MVLLAGTAKQDITPPLDVGFLMSALKAEWATFQRVRRPLYARAVVFDDGSRRVALVSLDLLGLAMRVFGGRRQFQGAILRAADHAITSRQLVLTSTHTHSAPETLGLTDLPKMPAFEAWGALLAERIGLAIKEAAGRLSPVEVGVGSSEAQGLCVYRRVRTRDGVMLAPPFPPAECIISKDGPVDSRLTITALSGPRGRLAVLLVNGACHPVHEMCSPWISSDYPGVLCDDLERRHPGAVALYLNGACGNINSFTVSGGADRAEEHGRLLARVVEEALPLSPTGQDAQLALMKRRVSLPGRKLNGDASRRSVRTEFAGLRLGPAAFLFLPGEVFAEIGVAIRSRFPSLHLSIVGYTADYIGYIPTDRAFDEGGYETGPGRWARVARGTEAIVVREAVRVLDDVTEHPARAKR